MSDEAKEPRPGKGKQDAVEVRRARRGDLAGIAEMVHKSARSKLQVEEADVMEWLFGKGLWVAAAGETVVGVAAWQAENLLSVTDVFYVAPARYRASAGAQLLDTVEAEAGVLMCEANILVLPTWTSKAVRTFLEKQGYEARVYADLHRIWREVLNEFVAGQEVDLMVKRLRERMVMAPV